MKRASATHTWHFLWPPSGPPPPHRHTHRCQLPGTRSHLCRKCIVNLVLDLSFWDVCHRKDVGISQLAAHTCLSVLLLFILSLKPAWCSDVIDWMITLPLTSIRSSPAVNQRLVCRHLRTSTQATLSPCCSVNYSYLSTVTAKGRVVKQSRGTQCGSRLTVMWEEHMFGEQTAAVLHRKSLKKGEINWLYYFSLIISAVWGLFHLDTIGIQSFFCFPIFIQALIQFHIANWRIKQWTKSWLCIIRFFCNFVKSCMI